MLSNAFAPPATVAADADVAPTLSHFTRRLIGLARVHLGGRLRHKVDPEDVVQSVYKSLLVRYRQTVMSPEGWQGLWGLLALITIRKCADRARYHHADCRDLRREAGACGQADSRSSCPQPPGREPTPDEVLVLAETVDALLAGMSGDEQAIVELSLHGYSTEEISQQLGRAERSIRRIRERVRKHLERQHTEAH